MRRHTNVLRILAGPRNGTSQPMMLRLYKSLILSRALYALPLLKLTDRQWAALEKAQRVALRICLGLPRSSPSQQTLNESGLNTVRNGAAERALRHLVRMAETSSAALLISRITARRRSQLGGHAALLHNIVGAPAAHIATPPPDEAPLRVQLYAGIRCPKRHLAAAALRQLAEGHCEEEFSGWLRVFTDGSVDPERRTATAAAVIPDAGSSATERLSFHASSTTAELAALRLGLELVKRERQPQRTVLLCDSRAALGLLRRLDKAPVLAREIAQTTRKLQGEGWEIAFQWQPAHCGIAGNEAADRLATTAHEDTACPLSEVPPFADARLLVHRTICARHPELENGPLPARVPKGLPREMAAVLHRLRTASAFTPAARARWHAGESGACRACAAPTADAEHLLLRCPAYAERRSALLARYQELGCHVQLEDLIRPGADRPTAEKALRALATFLAATGMSCWL